MLRYRKPLRLKEYDYSNPGGYFVTICTQNRECLFGDVKDEKMILNEAGGTIQEIWDGMKNRFPHVEQDVFVIMPNHVHFVILIRDPAAPPIASCTGAIYRAPGAMNGAPTLGEMVRYFKAKTAYTIRKTHPSLKIWQRNYHEHVIRNETTLNAIREYILNNPLKWHLDRYYSHGFSTGRSGKG